MSLWLTEGAENDLTSGYRFFSKHLLPEAHQRNLFPCLGFVISESVPHILGRVSALQQPHEVSQRNIGCWPITHALIKMGTVFSKTYTQGSGSEIHAATHWNLVDRSVTAQPSALSSSSILQPSSSRCAFISRQKENGHTFKKFNFLPLHFKSLT